MRLKDISILTPQYTGKPIDTDVSFVPMESLRNGNIDLKEISYMDAKGKYTFFGNGDLLVAKVTPCFENGNIAIAENLKEGIGFGSSEIFVLRFNKRALNTYMFYVTQSAKFQDAACATMCGVGGLKRISPLFMKTYEFNVPSITEQQRIVDYLDEKTKSIDARISVLEKKNDAYARLKSSIIYRAVTCGLNPNITLKDSGNKRIGKIPEHWTVKRIKNLCDFVSRGSTPDYVDDSPYKVMNQATFSKGVIDENKIRYSSKNPTDSNIHRGDLLMASTGGGILGKVFYFDSDDDNFYADSHVTIIRNSKGENLMKYLYYSFFIKYDEINATMVKGSTNQTELQRNNLIAYELAIPCLAEQKQIVDYLDIKCSEIDNAILNISKQIAALKRLKRSVINEVVTGKRKV